MPNPTVLGIFDSPYAAEKVKDELLDAGVARHRIVMSRPLAEDDAAVDESIVGKISASEESGERVRSGACVVAVVARSHLDKKHIAELMRRYGARETVEAP